MGSLLSVPAEGDGSKSRGRSCCSILGDEDADLERKAASPRSPASATLPRMWVAAPSDGCSYLPVRDQPSIYAARLPDRFLRPGQCFPVSEEYLGLDGIVYLRIADSSGGWAYNRDPVMGVAAVPAEVWQTLKIEHMAKQQANLRQRLLGDAEDKATVPAGPSGAEHPKGRAVGSSPSLSPLTLAAVDAKSKDRPSGSSSSSAFVEGKAKDAFALRSPPSPLDVQDTGCDASQASSFSLSPMSLASSPKRRAKGSPSFMEEDDRDSVASLRLSADGNLARISPPTPRWGEQALSPRETRRFLRERLAEVERAAEEERRAAEALQRNLTRAEEGCVKYRGKAEELAAQLEECERRCRAEAQQAYSLRGSAGEAKAEYAKLSTLYRNLQCQANQSAAEHRQAVAGRQLVEAKLQEARAELGELRGKKPLKVVLGGPGVPLLGAAASAPELQLQAVPRPRPPVPVAVQVEACTPAGASPSERAK